MLLIQRMDEFEKKYVREAEQEDKEQDDDKEED